MSSTDVELQIRPATVEDADAVADVLVRSRAAAVPAMPPLVHQPGDVRGHLAHMLAGPVEAWVALAEGEVVGYALLQDAWLDGLYVLPEHAGSGVGSALLAVVQHARPDGFALWVFESNEGARRFYRRHGLVELERTDGSGNEEKAPDIRMAWPGADPLAF